MISELIAVVPAVESALVGSVSDPTIWNGREPILQDQTSESNMLSTMPNDLLNYEQKGYARTAELILSPSAARSTVTSVERKRLLNKLLGLSISEKAVYVRVGAAIAFLDIALCSAKNVSDSGMKRDESMQLSTPKSQPALRVSVHILRRRKLGKSVLNRCAITDWRKNLSATRHTAAPGARVAEKLNCSSYPWTTLTITERGIRRRLGSHT